MMRAYLHDTSGAVADHFGVTENDVIVHVLPVHHATGIGIYFLSYIYSGACVEFRSGASIWVGHGNVGRRADCISFLVYQLSI
ncbi:AMP dependent synthetase and ligase [Histoplasma capsulatum var. duboisii H88]|uniref:AMP dependent synthetase and ligase n=1 Tax=Ajellomyces capsulatus (strain H88) TaxID=544711 RepID=A0A8A1LFA5_AJEC8|nr:AMP dependent synthetase and ligase [Histoplasma capsulatum var. duboisii H88]